MVFKLGEAFGDEKAIQTLIKLIGNKGYLTTAAESLVQILQDYQLGLAVSSLKDCLTELDENDFAH